jgi:large subunit ribosomal protein L1
MPKRGKRYRALAAQVGDKPYSLEEASTLIRSLANARFDETIEVHLKLGIDPKKTDQNVRGTVALPHGTGRRVRVIAITKGDGLAAAEQAGADLAGGEELINRISDGFLDFDAVVATPDMMAQIGSRLARLLGPRGLLPNPRSGTVGQDIAGMVRSLKAGRIEFRNDKTGVVHAPVGKASFAPEQLSENIRALLGALEAAKPAAAKGVYLRSLHLSSTMGPALLVSP